MKMSLQLAIISLAICWTIPLAIAAQEQITEPVTSVAFMPDGKKVVVAMEHAREIVILDAKTGLELHSLPVYTRGVAVSGDGNLICAALRNDDWRVHEIAVWETENFKETLRLKGHQDYISKLLFTQDNKQIVSASNDGTIGVWDLASGKMRLCLKEPRGSVNDITLSPDGSSIISGGGSWQGDTVGTLHEANCTIRVWSLIDGSEVRVLDAQPHLVCSIDITADGRYLIVGHQRNVRILDFKSGNEISDWDVENVNSIATDDTGTRLAIGTGQQVTGTLEVRRVPDGKKLLSIQSDILTREVVFSPDSSRILSSHGDQDVRKATGIRRFFTLFEGFPVDGKAMIWDATTGEPLLELKRVIE